MKYKLIYEIMAFIWITFLKYIVNRYVVFGFVYYFSGPYHPGGGGRVGEGVVGVVLARAAATPVLPLTRIFPCSKEILVLARNLQGNKIYKEMARENTQIKGNCKDFCKLYQLQVFNRKNQLINSIGLTKEVQKNLKIPFPAI